MSRPSLRRCVLPLVYACGLTAACSSPSDIDTAQSDDELTASWFAANAPPGSPEEAAILALVNDRAMSADAYVQTCDFSLAVSSAIVDWRQGDEPADTANLRSFDSLATIDNLPFTDRPFWAAALACAKAHYLQAPPACSAPTTCEKALHLGSISGDTGQEKLTQQGATSEWVTVRVTENETGIAAAALRTKATLVSPQGSNFDLFVYMPSTNDPNALECSAVQASSTKISGQDVVSLAWGEVPESVFANAIDDDRTLTFEVRHVSGTCDPAQKWTLTIEGNTCKPESPASCGPSCTPCPSPTNGSATCSEGTCGVVCDAGFVLSGSQCVEASSLNDDERISAGFEHTCAIKDDGAISCWGYNSDGQVKPPAGTFW